MIGETRLLSSWGRPHTRETEIICDICGKTGTHSIGLAGSAYFGGVIPVKDPRYVDKEAHVCRDHTIKELEKLFKGKVK